MDMQYQYTEKYIKDIAEAVRFIAGSTDTYSIKEMPAAILASNPPMLGKPSDLFATKFASQSDFRWGIYSEYPDESYFVTLDPMRSSGTMQIIKRGISWNVDFTSIEPMYKAIVDSNNTMFFTKGVEDSSCGIYLDNNGYPHIPNDMPLMFPEYGTDRSMGYNSNAGAWYRCVHIVGGYGIPNASWYSYLTTPSALSANPMFKNRFKAFGASALNSRIPVELYSILSDGDWHTGEELGGEFNINSLINPVTLPSGTEIRHAHMFNVLNHSEGNLGYYYGQWWGGHGGPTLVYLKADNDRWGINTNTFEFFRVGGGNRKGFGWQWDINSADQQYIRSNPHGIYPIGGNWDGVNKDTIDTIFTNQNYDAGEGTNWRVDNGYSKPASIDEIKSYLPFRTYDIVDQNDNVILPANATLADFGIS